MLYSFPLQTYKAFHLCNNASALLEYLTTIFDCATISRDIIDHQMQNLMLSLLKLTVLQSDLQKSTYSMKCLQKMCNFSCDFSVLYHSFSVAFQGRIITRAVFLVSFHSPLFMELNSGSCVFILLLGLSVGLMEVNRNALVCQWDYAVYAIKCTGVFAVSKGLRKTGDKREGFKSDVHDSVEEL